jgi:small-conductance mechanosensitive channel
LIVSSIAYTLRRRFIPFTPVGQRRATHQQDDNNLANPIDWNETISNASKKKMNWNTLFFETPFFTRLLSTLVLIAVAVSIRSIVVRRLMQKEAVDATIRRRWIVTARNITILAVFIIVVVIWLEQLQAVAATIVVIAAAIVLATKEFLFNILGFVYQSTAKFTEVGDRIEIDGIRGDVIDQSMLGFTLKAEKKPSRRIHDAGCKGPFLYFRKTLVNAFTTVSKGPRLK